MTHGFEREALAEYLETARYYGEQREGLGEEFIRAMEAAVVTIARDPERYQPVGDGLRLFRMKRFPYHLFYRFDERRNHTPRSSRWCINGDGPVTGGTGWRRTIRRGEELAELGQRCDGELASDSRRSATAGSFGASW